MNWWAIVVIVAVSAGVSVLRRHAHDQHLQRMADFERRKADLEQQLRSMRELAHSSMIWEDDGGSIINEQ